MTDWGNFEANKPLAGNAPSSPLDCAAVELLLAESAENMLPSAVAEQLRTHAAGCTACREKLAQVRRGHEWLLVLKQESLEPPVDLVAKILARTSFASAAGTQPASDASSTPNRKTLDFVIPNRVRHQHAGDAVVPGQDATSIDTDRHAHSSVVVLRRTFLEPRLALVAAMAFFSISLTLDLMGVRLTNLHASDLTPRGLHRAITRQYADTNARVVRYYENLRIVYEVEARVQQLRRAAETSAPPEQETKPRKQSSGSGGDSNTGRTNSYSADSRHKYMAANLPVQKIEQLPGNGQSSSTDSHVGVTIWHTLAASFVLQVKTLASLSPALPASSCSFPDIYFSMRSFSTRERRLA